MMVFGLLLLSLAPALAQPLAQAKAPQFFSSLDDIPLMPGLQELPDQAFSFDKPAGRIIEVWASAKNVQKVKILAYYQMALPQFGWGRIDDTSFFREQEKLTISFQIIDSQRFVKFMVNPIR
jgi:hypothetical protein